MLELILLALEDALWSGVASLGFAILFNVPVRTLFACALCGATGHAIRTLLIEAGLPIESATLAGATVVGFLGETFAHRWHAPAPVFTVPGVIPMIPGTFAYGAMIGVLRLTDTELGGLANEALLFDTAVNAIKTLIILVSLAVGIAAPSLLFQWRRQRPHKP
jgi:uncharacterized membrane protein YjjB (DUF3815 family)